MTEKGPGKRFNFGKLAKNVTNIKGDDHLAKGGRKGERGRRFGRKGGGRTGKDNKTKKGGKRDDNRRT